MTGSAVKNYAVALYELASEENISENVKKELSVITKAFDDDAEIYEILSAPTVSEEEKIGVLDSIFKGKISQITLDFLCLLAVKGRIKLLGDISGEFRRIWNDENDILEVSVTSAVALNTESRAKLKEKLSEKYGRQIIMEEKIDPSIIGGVIVRFGDTMLDGSVKSKLDRMRGNMKNVIA